VLCSSVLCRIGANGGAGSNAAGRRGVRRGGEPAVAAVAQAAAEDGLLRSMQAARGRAQERVQHVLPRLHERRALLPVPRLPPRPPRHPGELAALHTHSLPWIGAAGAGAGPFLSLERNGSFHPKALLSVSPPLIRLVVSCIPSKIATANLSLYALGKIQGS
jgi:hypothetical protein